MCDWHVYNKLLLTYLLFILTSYLEQVTWLVVTEVRSESFGLVTERRHYNARHLPSAFTTTHVIFLSSSVVSRAFSALCVYSQFGHHPHPLGYLCAKFRFFRGLHFELAHGEKSRTQSITQSIILLWCAGDRSFRFGIMTLYILYIFSWFVSI